MHEVGSAIIYVLYHALLGRWRWMRWVSYTGHVQIVNAKINWRGTSYGRQMRIWEYNNKLEIRSMLWECGQKLCGTGTSSSRCENNCAHLVVRKCGEFLYQLHSFARFSRKRLHHLTVYFQHSDYWNHRILRHSVTEICKFSSVTHGKL